MPTQPTIDVEMRLVAHDERFAALGAALAVTDDTDDADEQLAAAALRVCAATNDFTALHAVTGLAAVRSLRPWIEDSRLATRYAFQALVAAYLSRGAPPLWSRDHYDEVAASAPRDVAEVRRRAAASDDARVRHLFTAAARRSPRVHRRRGHRGVMADLLVTLSGVAFVVLALAAIAGLERL